jgi:hypothetical protein
MARCVLVWNCPSLSQLPPIYVPLLSHCDGLSYLCWVKWCEQLMQAYKTSWCPRKPRSLPGLMRSVCWDLRGSWYLRSQPFPRVTTKLFNQKSSSTLLSTSYIQHASLLFNTTSQHHVRLLVVPGSLLLCILIMYAQ